MIPIGISIFSIAGILIALSIIYLDKPEEPVPATPTFTPFGFIFLGTETSMPSPELEITPAEETVPEEPDEPILIETPLVDTVQAALPTFPALASSPAATGTGNILQTTPLEISTTTTITASTAATSTVSTITNRLDNIDPLLDYDGDWDHESNVAGAHQGTLSVSNAIDSDLIFSFTGRQLIIGYVSQAGLGALAISIDDSEFQLNQSAGREWVSPQLPNAEHDVIIVHDSGASVNLDYINILNAE